MWGRLSSLPFEMAREVAEAGWKACPTSGVVINSREDVVTPPGRGNRIGCDRRGPGRGRGYPGRALIRRSQAGAWGTRRKILRADTRLRPYRICRCSPFKKRLSILRLLVQ